MKIGLIAESLNGGKMSEGKTIGEYARAKGLDAPRIWDGCILNPTLTTVESKKPNPKNLSQELYLIETVVLEDGNWRTKRMWVREYILDQIARLAIRNVKRAVAKLETAKGLTGTISVYRITEVKE